MAYDLDDIRLTEIEDLTDEEKTFLKENKEELTDEEKETYKDVLEEKKKEEKEEGVSFKSEDELNTYLDKYYDTRKKKEEGEEVKEEEEEEEEKPLFASDYQPRDWNEFTKDLISKLPVHLKEAVREEIRSVREEEGKRIQEINKEFDQEIETLRKSDKDIPASGTKERREFDRDLAQTMVEFPGVMNMTQAYRIYEKIKGSDTKKEEKEEEEETSTEETARKVGKAGGGGSTSTRRRKYKTIATRDLDDATDAALRRLEETS